MIDRRTLLSSSACLLAERSVSIAASAPAAQPSDKAVFISKALAQIRQKLKADSDAAEKRGEFSSVAPPPDIVPFADWDWFYLKSGYAMWSPNAGQTYKPVIVPIGFTTDLASIPNLLWSAYPPEGRYAIAAIIHDYLYWEQARPRAEADDIFLTAMQDTNVNVVTRTAFWAAVRVVGESAWKNNSAAKARGERRILKKFPPDLLTTWPDWKKQPDVFK